jgi:predicted nucleotidyltransferase component of viral defense system
MIPKEFVEQWRVHAPWQNLMMIEQDLIISRALINLFNHSKISTNLAFRGGTALNKLYIKPPMRYSEDIDLVQINSEPIGETIKAIRQVLGPWLGEPKGKLTNRSAKLIYRYQSLNAIPAKLKIEINTTEHFHLRPLITLPHEVQSEWFKDQTEILTYHLDELMATKLCALYQRSKGRDLFDLWLVQKHDLVEIPNVLLLFQEYCEKIEARITRALFEKNLAEKRSRSDFSDDIRPLLAPEVAWHFEDAFQMVEETIIRHLPGKPWKR